MARILIIDDDDTLRGIIAKSLMHAGHSVSQANNGRKGVAMYRADPVDLVLTDMIMPEQEGIETIKILHREFPQLRIIAMSGGLEGSELYLNLTRRLGAACTLPKPFTLEQLKDAVEIVMEDFVPAKPAPAPSPDAAAGDAGGTPAPDGGPAAGV